MSTDDADDQVLVWGGRKMHNSDLSIQAELLERKSSASGSPIGPQGAVAEWCSKPNGAGLRGDAPLYYHYGPFLHPERGRKRRRENLTCWETGP